MNNLKSSIPEIELDVIALETKHEKDFERSQKVQRFSKTYKDKLSDTYLDGKYDGIQGFEPEAYQWLSAKYRSGYLRGITEKFNSKFNS